MRTETTTRVRRALAVAQLVVVALVGAWLGLLALGHVEVPIGPVQTRLAVTPSLHGGSVIRIPPLGTLTLASHQGPLQLDAEVQQLDEQDARQLVSDPAALRALPDRVGANTRSGLRKLALRAVVVGIGGAFLVGLVVYRRLRMAGLSAAVAAAALGASGLVAWATWRPASIAEPKYDGIIASAPSVVGDARSIVTNFGKYQQELAKVVTNVSKLYDVTSTLPTYNADPSTIRVLDVSDLHLNPAAWDVIRSLKEQFRIDVIIDSGDMTDHGTSAEDRFVTPISGLGVPYVFARGNHDSVETQLAVSRQKGAVVLDGAVVTVDGLRILGGPDPRFTPDKDTRGKPPEESLAQAGQALAQTAALDRTVDIAVTHDPETGKELDGIVPLVLAGHGHKRDVRYLDDGTLMFEQGSTGGAGLRGLEHEKPTPIECSVLYFDDRTHALQAWDDITIGGLGLTSATIERHVVPTGKDAPVLTTPSPSVSATS
jgi:predicted MPP superfamily phosphohydrolase